MFLTFFIGIILLLVIIWYYYNNLIAAKIRIQEAWSQIDVQLQRRADLIPNLVETVKGYAKHEKEVFEKVTEARSKLLSSVGPKDKAKAEDQLSSALKSLFAVAENYPKLMASENYLQLQKELADTEDKVAYSRQFYNKAVMDFNTKIKLFPTLIIASGLGFKEAEFFELKETERKSVKVNFS